MRIAILGAGAMGSWFGGMLAQTGNDVQLLTTNVAHRDAVHDHGLILQTGDVLLNIVIPISHPRDISTPVDLVILFTKSFQSHSAMSQITHALDKNTYVLSLQNGLGNSEIISQFVPVEQTLVGVTMMPVDMLAPGTVAKMGDGNSYFNSVQTHVSMIHDAILDAFNGTGIPMALDPDIHQRIWSKVAFNSGMNACCALAHGTPGTIGESDEAKVLVKDVATEVATIAGAHGVSVNIGEVFSMIDYACETHKNHKPSMLQDLLAGKRTEVDSLNGAVVSMGEKAGVPAPLNTILSTLVSLAEVSSRENR